jgi:hypothetical protein
MIALSAMSKGKAEYFFTFLLANFQNSYIFAARFRAEEYLARELGIKKATKRVV